MSQDIEFIESDLTPEEWEQRLKNVVWLRPKGDLELVGEYSTRLGCISCPPEDQESE